MEREKRITVYQDTIKKVEDGSYHCEGEDILIGTPATSQFYSEEIMVDFDNLPTYDETIAVEPMDCLTMAEREVRKGNSVAVLNMASLVTPGGGVLKGSGAQEENIFRRTNIFKTLYPFKVGIAREFNIIPNIKQYPLDENFGGIYSPDITVFKGQEDQGYPLLSKPFKVNVVTVAAYRNPELTNDGKFTVEVEAKTRNKIKTILNICLINGNDTIILSAFGCGAFHTPPSLMARLFKEILESEEYKNRFKFVGFAILNDYNAHREHNPQGNYKPFKDVFTEPSS